MKRFDIVGLTIIEGASKKTSEVIIAKSETEAKDKFLNKVGMEYAVVKCIELLEEEL